MCFGLTQLSDLVWRQKIQKPGKKSKKYVKKAWPKTWFIFRDSDSVTFFDRENGSKMFIKWEHFVSPNFLVFSGALWHFLALFRAIWAYF